MESPDYEAAHDRNNHSMTFRNIRSISILPLLLLPALLAGCGERGVRSRTRRGQEPLPPLIQAAPSASEEELLIDAQKKVVLGRPGSYDQVRDVAENVEPILRQALDQITIGGLIKQDAAGAGMSVPQFKKYFVGKQAADILLESGGDPNALSSAGAAGVAQWLAGTGRARGYLKIDEAQSNLITSQIDLAAADLARLRKLPSSFTEIWPPAAAAAPAHSSAGSASATRPATNRAAGDKPSVTPRTTAPAAPAAMAPQPRSWTRDELIQLRKNQIRGLVAQRRLVDQRYDPKLALFAQTRYLIWMWRKYPSLDWVFEAYHGGEMGVERTLRTFLGARWSNAGSVTHAILGEDRSGRKVERPISYSSVFFSTTPRAFPATFAYLYGRRDDHRLYWFKLLMAERAIEWYQKNPRSLKNEWEALRPGYRLEDAWYPDLQDRLYSDVRAVNTARKRNRLTRVGKTPVPGAAIAKVTGLPGSGDPALDVTRPEVIGALAKVVKTYREQSLRPETILVGALTQPQTVVDEIRARFPLPRRKNPLPPGFVPPSDLPDLHAAGLAVDILQPNDKWQARVLQYALSYWEDRERIHFNSEVWGSVHAWRIVPNPEFRTELRSEVSPHAHRAA